jgi:hypothetical protein
MGKRTTEKKAVAAKQSSTSRLGILPEGKGEAKS